MTCIGKIKMDNSPILSILQNHVNPVKSVKSETQKGDTRVGIAFRLFDKQGL
jgi:hypothetical protein